MRLRVVDVEALVNCRVQEFHKRAIIVKLGVGDNASNGHAKIGGRDIIVVEAQCGTNDAVVDPQVPCHINNLHKIRQQASKRHSTHHAIGTKEGWTSSILGRSRT